MMKRKQIIAAWMAGILCMLAVAGCSPKSAGTADLDGTAQLATVGQDAVSLQEGYFMTKWQQARYANMATQIYGDQWYDVTLDTETMTFQERIKEDVKSQIELLHLCRQYADEYKVALNEKEKKNAQEVAQQFINANTQEARDAMMADEELVTGVLEDYALYNKLCDTVIAQSDVEVTEEEAKCRTYDYVYQALTDTDEDGNTVEMTTVEQQAYLEILENIIASVKKGETFEKAAADAGYTVASHAYCKADNDSFSDINGEADKLKVGDISEVIVVEGGLFLITVTSDDDKEQSEEKRTQLLQERSMEYFNKVYEGWRDKETITWDEDLWDQITFEQPITAKAAEE